MLNQVSKHVPTSSISTHPSLQVLRSSLHATNDTVNICTKRHLKYRTAMGTYANK